MSSIRTIARVCAALLAVVTCGATNTIPLLTIGDRTFTNATVRKVGPHTAIVRDGAGFTSTAITNLPEPFKTRLIDTNELRLLEQSRIERAERDALAAQRRAAAIREAIEDKKYVEIKVRVERIRGDGIIGTRMKDEPIYGEPVTVGTVNRMQRIGAGSSRVGPTTYRPIVGHNTVEVNPVFLTNPPRTATHGKTITIRAKIIDPQMVDGRKLECWQAR